MSVWTTYLKEKQDNNEIVKVYLKSKTGKESKVNSIMLTGLIHSFDEETIRLERKECIIERSDVISIKPDDGR